MSETKRNQLGYEKFYALCEALRNQREQIGKMTTVGGAAVLINKHLTFNVTEAHVRKALAFLNITLATTPRRNSPGNARVLGRALVGLYRKLGETPPAELVDMLRRHEGKPTPLTDPPATSPPPPPPPPAAAAQAVAAVPVASVSNPQDMRLAGRLGNANGAAAVR